MLACACRLPSGPPAQMIKPEGAMIFALLVVVGACVAIAGPAFTLLAGKSIGLGTVVMGVLAALPVICGTLIVIVAEMKIAERQPHDKPQREDREIERQPRYQPWWEDSDWDESAETIQPAPPRDHIAAVGGPPPAMHVSSASLDAQGRVDRDQPLDGEVVIVPGEARYHRSGCELIRLLASDDLKTSSRQKAEAGGRVPCQACKPEKPLSAQN
jgi:hypothetical protein